MATSPADRFSPLLQRAKDEGHCAILNLIVRPVVVPPHAGAWRLLQDIKDSDQQQLCQQLHRALQPED
eukprot:9819048-Prorocentrum_lima.AAC.1